MSVYTINEKSGWVTVWLVPNGMTYFLGDIGWN